MPKNGDAYTVVLKKAHLAWGTYRKSHTRRRIPDEGYIPIPAKIARDYHIYNSHHRGNAIGYNLYNFKSEDGSLNGVLKAGGCKRANDEYAKQFAVEKDLKKIGRWYQDCKAHEGDTVEVRWTSDSDIVIKHIPAGN